MKCMHKFYLLARNNIYQKMIQNNAKNRCEKKIYIFHFLTPNHVTYPYSLNKNLMFKYNILQRFMTPQHV